MDPMWIDQRKFIAPEVSECFDEFCQRWPRKARECVALRLNEAAARLRQSADDLELAGFVANVSDCEGTIRCMLALLVAITPEVDTAIAQEAGKGGENG